MSETQDTSSRPMSGLPAIPSASEQPGPGGEPVSITWSGSPWSLAGLGLVNLLLTIVTLGIYQFWGRTEVRKRIWSSVRINGEPLEYTGTGKELFLGFLIVFFLVLVPTILVILGLQIVFGPQSLWLAGGILAIYVVLFFLIGVAIYRARRYRLSRTRWRGIRGALVGSPSSYAWRHFLTILLIPFTLGWIMPWRSNMLYRTITNETRFGDRPFSYDGRSSRFYLPFAVTWIGALVCLGLFSGAFYYLLGDRILEIGEAAEQGVTLTFTAWENAQVVALAIATLGIYVLFSAWYQARMLFTFSRFTQFDGARFRLDVTAPGLIWQFVSNYVLSVFTLGILRPVAEARFSRYLVDRLQVEGTIDFAAVAQSQHRLDKTGEGLASAFDVDAFG